MKKFILVVFCFVVSIGSTFANCDGDPSGDVRLVGHNLIPWSAGIIGVTKFVEAAEMISTIEQSETMYNEWGFEYTEFTSSYDYSVDLEFFRETLEAESGITIPDGLRANMTTTFTFIGDTILETYFTYVYPKDDLGLLALDHKFNQLYFYYEKIGVDENGDDLDHDSEDDITKYIHDLYSDPDSYYLSYNDGSVIIEAYEENGEYFLQGLLANPEILDMITTEETME